MEMGWNQWVAPTSTRKGLSAIAAVLALAAAGLVGTAHAGIADTKHNLTAGPGGNKFTPSTAGTEEICVFCHTPHGSDTSAAVPLWNRKMAGEFTLDANGAPTTTKTYNTYDNLKTSTLDGSTMSVGSVSLACLSCHDGQTSMSAVINAPGSGGYVPNGAEIPGSWVGATGGLMPSGSIANIGRDLRNDHPIGIQYAGGKYGAATGGNPNKQDPDFKAAQTSTLNNTAVWWVDTAGFTPAGTGATLQGGNTGKRDKTDMILYTRTFESVDQPFVECASCHDPHSENTTFLRIPNAASAVCLACHTK
jgi:predicted CXXCH cytochrome family protein